MVMHAELTRGTAAQAVTPSTAAADLLGTAGANISVAAGAASADSDPAPRDGIMIIGMGPGMATRLRITRTGEAALVSDPLYLGPNVWHFPVKRGEIVSFFGDAGITTANVSVCMAKG